MSRTSHVSSPSQRDKPKPWVFSANEIEMSDNVIGRGAFGEVRIAKWRSINVAAKFLHADDDCESQSEESKNEISENLQKEIEILSQLRHPNLVLFIGIIETQGTYHICIYALNWLLIL